MCINCHVHFDNFYYTADDPDSISVSFAEPSFPDALDGGKYARCYSMEQAITYIPQKWPLSLIVNCIGMLLLNFNNLRLTTIHIITVWNTNRLN